MIGVRIEERSRFSVRYHISLPDELTPYMFKPELTVCYGVDISNVPTAVLNIPGVCAMASMSWIAGVPIQVGVLDADCTAGLEAMRRALIDLGAKLPALQQAVVTKTERVEAVQRGRTGLLYTAGLDSTYTYMRHAEKDLDLVTLNGPQKNMVGTPHWAQYRGRMLEFAWEERRSVFFASTDARLVVDERGFDEAFLVKPRGWWLVGHSALMLGMTAPLAYIRGWDRTLIAATWEDSSRAWGSLPETDEKLSWFGVPVVHDGVVPRREKFKRIAAAERPTYLHICPFTVPNCGGCEKCFAAQVSLVALGEDPKEYGFPNRPNLFRRAWYFIQRTHRTHNPFWDDVKKLLDQAEIKNDDCLEFADRLVGLPEDFRGRAEYQDSLAWSPHLGGGSMNVSFVQLTDIHFGRRYGGQLTDLDWVGPLTRELDPNFVVVTGDTSADSKDFAVVGKQLDITCPTHWLVGNHEVDYPVQPHLEEAFARDVGPLTYHFDHKGWRFICLYVRQTVSAAGPDSLSAGKLNADPRHIRWLENWSIPGRTGVFCHICPLDQDGCSGSAWAKELVKVMERKKIRFLACGHEHFWRHVERNGVHYFVSPMTGALAPLGRELVHYKLSKDTVEAQVYHATAEGKIELRQHWPEKLGERRG